MVMAKGDTFSVIYNTTQNNSATYTADKDGSVVGGMSELECTFVSGPNTFKFSDGDKIQVKLETGGVVDAYTKAESDNRFMPYDITTLPKYVP